MAYATFAEMAALRPGGIEAEDQERAEALLDEASWLIEEATGLTYPVPSLAPSAWKSVCRNAALRFFENPNDVTMEQIGGGYMYQRPMGRVVGVDLTTRERARVRKAAGLASVGSIRMVAGIDEEAMGTILATGKIE